MNADYQRFDEKVPKILVRLHPANSERLYLRSERMEFQLFNTLYQARNTSLRQS